MRSFYVFSLTRIFLPAPFIGCIVNFYRITATQLRSRCSDRHCIAWVLVVLKYSLAKNVLLCLDEKWYGRFSIYFIACKIPPVLPIFVWYSIRKHNFVYIDLKHVNYPSFHVEICRCHLYLTKFKTRHWLLYVFELIIRKNFFERTYLIPS